MADKNAIRLYGEERWISPYVFSCFVTLREKQLPFDLSTLQLDAGEQQRGPFRDRSLTGKVPALEHAGFWLAESSAIIEYLEESFPPPAYPRVLPSDVQQRARARQIMAWVRSDLQALREERPTTTMFYERASKPLSEAGRAAAEKLLRVADLLIPTGAMVLFDSWSIADADLAFMLHRLILNGHEVPAKVRDFAAAQWQRPAVREYVGHARPPAA